MQLFSQDTVYVGNFNSATLHKGGNTMKKILATVVFGSVIAMSGSAMAAESAACQASWTKMDPTGSGFASSTSAAKEMAEMKSAGLRTAAEDKLSAKEYMDACTKDVFKNMK